MASILQKTKEYDEFYDQVESEGGKYVDNCSCTPCCCARCNVETYKMLDGSYKTFPLIKMYKDTDWRCEECHSKVDGDFFRAELGEWLCSNCYTIKKGR